ncbi:retrovirus-related pol polyprotein from transposon TNT 1-94 [Tanacetum coccineum]
MKVEESLNVTFDESPPLTKLSPLVDDDVDEEEAIENNVKVSNNNNTEDEFLEVYRNKLDENGIVSRNKARLVAQGYNQQEGIDYDETYAPVARLESIRILLAIACANDFKLYQMDIKSAFLNGFINEEVYVSQPLAQPSGFIDFEKPNYVYKLKKTLYGLKKAHKSWYDRLNAFLLKHEYSMGMVDNTLFIKKFKSHLIIVQIYVDDIIFRSTCQNLCDDFAKIMHDGFEMSMMGELNFFLGLKIKQMEDGIFFNQSKYIKEMLKKFGLEDSKPTKTPMSTEIKLTKDDKAESVGSTKYQALERHLEEIHVTWAHLEKKRTRLRLYTKSLKEIIIQAVEAASPTRATALKLDQDGVRNSCSSSLFTWALLEDLALYDNKSWNDPKNFINWSRQSLCPRMSRDAKLSKFEADFKQQQSKMTNKIDTVLKAITDRIMGALLSDTVKNPKLNVNPTSLVLSARSYPMEDPQCSTRIYSSINVITICPKQPNKSRDDKSDEEEEEKADPKNINTTPPSPLDLSILFIRESS